jgi:hypothetical protein
MALCTWGFITEHDCQSELETNFSQQYPILCLGIDPQWWRWRFFPKLPTEPCALGSTQPLKMSIRKTPGGKDGRYVRVTTLPSSKCRKSRKSGALSYRIPQGPVQACSGTVLPLPNTVSTKPVSSSWGMRKIELTALRKTPTRQWQSFSHNSPMSTVLNLPNSLKADTWSQANTHIHHMRRYFILLCKERIIW